MTGASTELRPVLVVKGRCVLCGCTEGAACFLEEAGGACWWVNRDKTLCSHHPQRDLKRAVELIKGIRPRTWKEYVRVLVNAGYTEQRAEEILTDPAQLDRELAREARKLEELGAREVADLVRSHMGKR